MNGRYGQPITTSPVEVANEVTHSSAGRVPQPNFIPAPGNPARILRWAAFGVRHAYSLICRAGTTAGRTNTGATTRFGSGLAITLLVGVVFAKGSPAPSD
ncbi:MAG: hypothetical protein KC592_19995 [Nitrospira sp.]|nr:hypothetical protein [Nitrospira sp.]